MPFIPAGSGNTENSSVLEDNISGGRSNGG